METRGVTRFKIFFQASRRAVISGAGRFELPEGVQPIFFNFVFFGKLSLASTWRSKWHKLCIFALSFPPESGKK